MGATATLSVVEMLTNQGTARPSVQHVLEDKATERRRGYTHVGQHSTILAGPSSLSRLGHRTTETYLWFRDGQFLFTFSPFTKEWCDDEANEKD